MKISKAPGVGIGPAENRTKPIIVFVIAFLMVLGDVQMTSAQTARLLPTASGTGTCTDITAYGGSPANPDNRAALAAALNASSGGGGCVSFPPGRFTFAANFRFVLPNGSASITLTGAGADVTQLYWPTGGGLSIEYVGAENSVHLRNSPSLSASNRGQDWEPWTNSSGSWLAGSGLTGERHPAQAFAAQVAVFIRLDRNTKLVTKAC